MSSAISRTCLTHQGTWDMEAKQENTRTTRAKGSLRRSRSVLFWYFRISRRATVPGLYRRFFGGPSRPECKSRVPTRQCAIPPCKSRARARSLWKDIKYHIRCPDGPPRGPRPLLPLSPSSSPSLPPPPPPPLSCCREGSRPPVDLRAVCAGATFGRFDGGGGVESWASRAAGCLRFCFLCTVCAIANRTKRSEGEWKKGKRD